jgi:hypothetical protein
MTQSAELRYPKMVPIAWRFLSLAGGSLLAAKASLRLRTRNVTCATEGDEGRPYIPIHAQQSRGRLDKLEITPMPEVTLTTYLVSFAVVLAAIPFAWAMLDFRSLPRSKRSDLGVQGVGNLTFIGSRRLRLK